MSARSFRELVAIEAPRYEAVVAAIEEWHNEQHAGPLVFCAENPCASIINAVRYADD